MRKTLIATLFLCILIQPQRSDAIAYCALRDPIDAIQFLFPHADTHRSIVRAIDNDVRQQILESLSFSLHFNELGKHTLYTILKGNAPIGLVHVRSEPAPWGLMEVAWALSADLTVQNFMFQRCRSEICSPETVSEMLNLLVGKTTSELQSYLSDAGDGLSPTIADTVKIKDKTFVAALIRSALKTIAVTGVTWKDEVDKLQRGRLLSRAFGSSKLLLTESESNTNALNALRDYRDGGSSMLLPASIRAFKITDGANLVGYSASARWHDHERARTTHWIFDDQGKILANRTTPTFADAYDAEIFQQLLGLDVSIEENCSTAAQMMGHDLYFVASFKGH